MIKILTIMLLPFLLSACTTIKVVDDNSIKVPKQKQCEDYSLLDGKSFADALNTIARNKKIYENCKNIVDFQNNLIEVLAKPK